jgi:hypothetical protein
VSAHFDMEIHDDEFQSGVPADKQPTVSDVLRAWVMVIGILAILIQGIRDTRKKKS